MRSAPQRGLRPAISRMSAARVVGGRPDRRERRPSWLQIPSVRRRCKTRHVIDLLRFVCGLAVDLVRHRVELVAENALLRQQLIAAERKVAGRVRWRPWQRFTIVLAARVAPAWREATCSSSPRPFFVGIAQDSARSGGIALSGRDDRRRRVPRSSARWRGITHVGVPSASVASCSS